MFRRQNRKKVRIEKTNFCFNMRFVRGLYGRLRGNEACRSKFYE